MHFLTVMLDLSCYATLINNITFFLNICEWGASVDWITPGADAINISGLLVLEPRLLHPKKLGNVKNWMLLKNLSSLDSYFLEMWEPKLRSDMWFPNFTPHSYVDV